MRKALYLAACIPSIAVADVTAPPLEDKLATASEFRSAMLSWDVPPARPLITGVDAPVATSNISSSFGTRRDPILRTIRLHAGIDIPGLTGTPIRASSDGYVTWASGVRGYGNLVEIDHGMALRTRYAHLSRIVVGTGEFVRKGEMIGLMGSSGRSTGSHLHFEVRMGGKPLDPTRYLTSGATIAGAAAIPPPEVNARGSAFSSSAALPAPVLP